ncbi:transposase [Micromonospora vinacea]|uniref:IS701 family transposase n=1 Tax=Micromonospora vinacea TaxID=709878 RepID=UPI00344C5AD9
MGGLGRRRVRDDVRNYVIEHLGDPGGVLIVDDTGFLKKGTRSAGLQRQYSGTAVRTEDCQVRTFLAYRSSKGHALIDRQLYLPASWTDDRDRCRAAGLPDKVQFATKVQMARDMLARALDAGVPVGWVTMDEALRAVEIPAGLVGTPGCGLCGRDPPQRRHDHHHDGPVPRGRPDRRPPRARHRGSAGHRRRNVGSTWRREVRERRRPRRAGWRPTIRWCCRPRWW